MIKKTIKPQEEHKQWLNFFWSKFGGKKIDISNNYSAKISLLIFMSKIVINYKKQQTLEERRQKFNNIKYSRHSLTSHKKCFACPNLANVRHHIILLNNGGINSKRNLVSLCNECHKKIHNWL